MEICQAMVVTSCHIRPVCSMLRQFAWLMRVVIVSTPVVNWYLVNGFKEISMSSSVALLHLPLRINTARIANRNGGYGFRIPAGEIYFHKILPSGCGIHPASFSVGSGVIYKRQIGRGAKFTVNSIYYRG